MRVGEWYWKTVDGLSMYSKIWEPEGAVKGIICLIHGVSEHIDRYQAQAEALTDAGYVLAGFDQRGFGKSAGRRGHTPSMEAYFDDIDSFIEEIRAQYSDIPLFLYGHSMGGILVLAYTPIRCPSVRGAIVTSPGLNTALHGQVVKTVLLKLLGKVWPTFGFNSGIDIQMLSRDPTVWRQYAADPLVHTRITLGWANAMLNGIGLAFENASRFPVPILLMHGTGDRIALPDGTGKIAERLANGNVTLKWWDGFKHELHTDPQKRDVFKMMINWLNLLPSPFLHEKIE